MKTLLLILLVGYMIFGPTSKTKNENESLGIKSKDHTLSGSQKRFAVNGKADRVLFLDADGRVLQPIAKD